MPLPTCIYLYSKTYKWPARKQSAMMHASMGMTYTALSNIAIPINHDINFSRSSLCTCSVCERTAAQGRKTYRELWTIDDSQLDCIFHGWNIEAHRSQFQVCVLAIYLQGQRRMGKGILWVVDRRWQPIRLTASSRSWMLHGCNGESCIFKSINY